MSAYDVSMSAYIPYNVSMSAYDVSMSAYDFYVTKLKYNIPRTYRQKTETRDVGSKKKVVFCNWKAK